MNEEVWHILVQTSKESPVSILKNLTREMARKAMQTFYPHNPWSDEAIKEAITREDRLKEYHRVQKAHQLSYGSGQVMGMYGGFHETPYGQHRCALLDCWGPEGETMDVWPKPADYDDRLARAEEAYEQVRKINAEIGEAA